VRRGPATPSGSLQKIAATVVTVVLAFAILAFGSAGGRAGTAISNGAGEPASRDTIATADTCRERVHVYYFHRNIRCQTCRTFEAYSLEALTTGFADELRDGRIVWEVLNMDDQSNSRLVDAYDVFESSLIVSVVEDGEEKSWEKLEAIWGLVRDKSAFLDYVSAEVDSALAAETKEAPHYGERPLPVHGQLVPQSDG
jgi:hypothetical protein